MKKIDRVHRFTKIFIKFALVGVSGVLVNLAVYTPLTMFGVNYFAAAVISFIVAVSSNFVLNMVWAFRGYGAKKSTHHKYVMFFVVSLLNLGVNLLVLYYLVEKLNLHHLFSQLVAIGVASVFNFLLNYFITFDVTKGRTPKHGK